MEGWEQRVGLLPGLFGHCQGEMSSCQTPQEEDEGSGMVGMAAAAATLFHVSDTRGCSAITFLCCRACSCCWIWDASPAIPAFPAALCSQCRREWQLGWALAVCRKQFVTED